MYGPLALVGGDEFHPGNEHQDEILRDACAGRPAYVVATAAQDFASGAVEAARRWFAGLGLEVRELRIRTKEDARSPEIVAEAAEAPDSSTSPAAIPAGSSRCSGRARSGRRSPPPGGPARRSPGRPPAPWRSASGAWSRRAGRVRSTSARSTPWAWSRAARSSPTSTCSATPGSRGLRRGSARRHRSSASTSAPPRCSATAAGRWSGPGAVTILQGPLRRRHIEGEKIDEMSNPEP